MKGREVVAIGGFGHTALLLPAQEGLGLDDG